MKRFCFTCILSVSLLLNIALGIGFGYCYGLNRGYQMFLLPMETSVNAKEAVVGKVHALPKLPVGKK